MAHTLRWLRLLQLGLLGGILLGAAVGEYAGPRSMAANPALDYMFTTIGIAVVGTIFVVRRTLVLRPAESLAFRPDDALSLGHWKTGHITTYALCEVLALFGLVLRLLGCSFRQSLPFYAGGFLLLFFFAPRRPATT